MSRPFNIHCMLPVEQTTSKKDASTLSSMIQAAESGRTSRRSHARLEASALEDSKLFSKDLEQFLNEEAARTNASPTASAIIAFQRGQSTHANSEEECPDPPISAADDSYAAVTQTPRDRHHFVDTHHQAKFHHKTPQASHRG